MRLKLWFSKMLRGKAGNTIVDTLVGFAVQMGVLIVALFALAYMANALKVYFACNKVARSIEVSGIVDARTYAIVDEFAGESLPVTVDIDAQYYDAAAGKIQLRDSFKVTLSSSYAIPIIMPLTGGAPVTIHVPIKISMTGISEVYWR